MTLLLFLLKHLRHGIYVILHAMVAIIEPPLLSVLEVGDEVTLGQCALLQCISCLITIYLGVPWGHLNGAQVFQIVKNGVVVNVTVGVLAFEPPDEVAMEEIETKEGAAILPYLTLSMERLAPIGGCHSRRRELIFSTKACRRHMVYTSKDSEEARRTVWSSRSRNSQMRCHTW
jgi:hypothetical protein